MRLAGLLSLLMLVAIGCETHSTDSPTNNPAAASHQPGIAASADQVRPISADNAAPSASMRTADGATVTMTSVYQQKPTVLVFYRGGWCPFCNKHLEEVGRNADALRDMGFQIIGISPDKPSELAKTVDKTHVDYTLLSDADAELIKAFGLAFEVDQPTRTKYKGYGIDLEAASGYEHHALPVPAVYLIDTDGQIQFAHWDADYKSRLSGEAIIEAARKIAG